MTCYSDARTCNRSIKPFPDIQGPLVQYGHSFVKKNKLRWSFFWKKKFHIFADLSLKILQYGSWCAESDGGISIKILWLLEGFSSFSKIKLNGCNIFGSSSQFFYMPIDIKILFFRVSVTVKPCRSLLTVRYQKLFNSSLRLWRHLSACKWRCILFVKTKKHISY